MDGIIVINKEKDYTSRDVVNVLNKVLKTKKIGHTGTLDPIATGVLVICIGKYTKLVPLITDYEKEYMATIKLGVRTDTLDITGEILEENNNVIVDNSVVINILNSFLGESEQVVPIYSAIKINGKKLYQYARANEEITLPKRSVFIKEIELISNKDGFIKFRCLVSKGTYIRSLINDITKKLNVLGTMSELDRISQGEFKKINSYTLEDIKNNNYKLLKIEDIFNYPIYELKDLEYNKLINGVILNLKTKEEYFLGKYNNHFIGVIKKVEMGYKLIFRT